MADTIQFPEDFTPDLAPSYDTKILGYNPNTGKPIYTTVEALQAQAASQILGVVTPSDSPSGDETNGQSYRVSNTTGDVLAFPNFLDSNGDPVQMEADERSGYIVKNADGWAYSDNTAEADVSGLMEKGEDFNGTGAELNAVKLDKADIKYKITSAQQFDKAAVLRDMTIDTSGVLIANAGSITSAAIPIPEGELYIGVAGLSSAVNSPHRYRFLDSNGDYIEGSVGLIIYGRTSDLIEKYTGASYFQIVVKNTSEPNEDMLDSLSTTFGKVLSGNLFDRQAYLDNTRIASTGGLVTASGYKTTEPTEIPAGSTALFLDGLKQFNHSLRFLNAAGAYISGSYTSIYSYSQGGLFPLPAGAAFVQVTYKNGSEPDDDVDNTFILAFSDTTPTALSYTKIVEGVGDAVVLNYDSDLYSDYIVGTTQTPTFSNDQLTKIEHKRDGVTVRTDTFTYSSNTITETRVTDNGRVVFVTDLTTLITQISN